jgi:hypothetical protein
MRLQSRQPPLVVEHALGQAVDALGHLAQALANHSDARQAVQDVGGKTHRLIS